MLAVPEKKIPITEIPLNRGVKLFLKREDLVHPEISGNKYWKLFYTANQYLESNAIHPLMISFGGAFSNHIAALSALGKISSIPTLAVIRGDELKGVWQQNPTLKLAAENGMKFRFVTREDYRNKQLISEKLQAEFPNALIIPEGGTNTLAVEGVKNMLSIDTQLFDYLCTAVGTGGTVAGISKFAEEDQKVLGFKVVSDSSLEQTVLKLSGKSNFNIFEAHFGGYGKISDEIIRFINDFAEKFHIQLEPVYTGKMMMKLFELIENDFFPENSKILAFHTGGLQGLLGVNQMLTRQNKKEIKII